MSTKVALNFVGFGWNFVINTTFLMNDDEDQDDGILQAVSAGLIDDSSGTQETWELLIERPLALWTISSLPFASIH